MNTNGSQNQYHNYNYNYDPNGVTQSGVDHYDQEGAFSRILKSPILAVAALLLVGAAFASVIVMSYSGSENGDVPVVQAQDTAFKVAPNDRGGLNVPFQDSTVFESLAGAEINESAPVENLLSGDQSMARLEAFAAEAERLIEESEAARAAAEIRSIETAALIEQATGVTPPSPSSVAAPSEAVAVAPSENLLRRIEPSSGGVQQPGNIYIAGVQERPSQPAPVQQSIAVLREPTPAPRETAQERVQETVVANVAVPASKPVVAPEMTAQQAAAIAPAAGFAITPGTHYVQLGSVKSQAGASSQWGVFKRKYAAELSDVKYRVERADLGERGTFYRIQAGPMSGESATEICKSIKEQTPGGCIVVK